jgi:multidrug resistance efflux pump
MIGFLTLSYAGVLWVLVKLKVLPNKATTWLSIVGWVVLLLVVLFIPMMWGAPSGPVRLMTYTVQIIPNVSGRVTEVPIKPNMPLKQGAVLLKLDPTVYQAAVNSLEAQLRFQNLRLEQYQTLATKQAGTRFQVQETQAEVDQLRAQLEDAKWKLGETIVRAPSRGYVTALALRPGQRVTTSPLAPAMTFVDTAAHMVILQIDQIYHRHLRVGQDAEIAFKTRPGRIFKAKVDGLVQVTSQSQLVTSGTVPAAAQISPEPLFVRLDLEDQSVASGLPAGTTGSAAVYTNSVQFTHLIRKVMMRMQTYLNFIIP